MYKFTRSSLAGLFALSIFTTPFAFAQTSTAPQITANQIPNCPSPGEGKDSKDQPGCFDFYVMSQIWLPESCIKIDNSGYRADPEACKSLADNFSGEVTPHGLWQNYETGGYPSYCTDEQLDFEGLSEASRRALRVLYPDVVRDLPGHEWSKHGTCDNTSQQAYFDKLIDRQAVLEQANALVKKNSGKAVAYSALVDAYGGQSMVKLFCNRYENKDDASYPRQYLSEIFTFWSKDLSTQLNKGAVASCDPALPVYIRPTATFISMDDWKKRFAAKYPEPAAVGFDVDDTVLFSSPGFHYLINFKGLSTRGEVFWNWMNNGFDEMSIPKASGRELVQFHRNRGDVVYFITRRPGTEVEELTSVLNVVMEAGVNIPVVFTDEQSKTPYIKKRAIDVYYGDSDTDITEAEAAGAEGVRVMRSSASTATSPNDNGAYGEVVIMNSDH
ncbi:MAG: hypothetical protein OIF57_18555 [Marinobacterium sp.]|nr:hypothetical protein [Marinobacterium sp.]